MTDFLSIEFENEEEIQFNIERIFDAARRKTRDIIGDAANIGAYWLRIYVPIFQGYTWREISSSGPSWRPGGAGGGGEWQAVAGVKRGTSKHPLYAAQGTGLYAVDPSKTVYGAGNQIRARTYGKKMRIERGVTPPGVIWRKYVRGQRPQPFLYMAFQQTRLYVNARVHSFDLAGV